MLRDGGRERSHVALDEVGALFVVEGVLCVDVVHTCPAEESPCPNVSEHFIIHLRAEVYGGVCGEGPPPGGGGVEIEGK